MLKDLCRLAAAERVAAEKELDEVGDEIPDHATSVPAIKLADGNLKSFGGSFG